MLPVKLKHGFKGQVSLTLPKTIQSRISSHTVAKRLYFSDIGYYPDAAFHHRKRIHGCNQYILIYCTKGEGWYYSNKKRYTVKAGEYLILPQNKAHEYGASETDPWSIYWVHFAGDNAAFISDFIASNEHGPRQVSPSCLRTILFYDMLDHMKFMNNMDNILYANSCLSTFLLSFRAKQARLEKKDNDLVDKIMALMNTDLKRNWVLQELARQVNLSPSYISLVFRNKINQSPINFLVSLKMQKASQMLGSCQLAVKEIAESLGYDDPYHFSRVFKRVMGVSPKNFKQNL